MCGERIVDMRRVMSLSPTQQTAIAHSHAT